MLHHDLLLKSWKQSSIPFIQSPLSLNIQLYYCYYAIMFNMFMAMNNHLTISCNYFGQRSKQLNYINYSCSQRYLLFCVISGIYYCFNMVLIMMSIFMSSVIINISRRGETLNKVPGWLRTVCIKRLAHKCSQLFTEMSHFFGIDRNFACVKFEERSLNPSKVIALTTKLWRGGRRRGGGGGGIADENIIFPKTYVSREYNKLQTDLLLHNLY